MRIAPRHGNSTTSLDAKIAQLTAAIETGGHLPTLLEALKRREAERTAIQTELQTLTVATVTRPKDRRALERRLREKLTDWRGLLMTDITTARQVLDTVLSNRLVFTPTTDETGVRCYRMSGTLALGRIWSEILRSQVRSGVPDGIRPRVRARDCGDRSTRRVSLVAE